MSELLIAVMFGIGRLMNLTTSSSSPPPVETFYLTTQGSDPLITEGGDNLVTEDAP